MLPVIRIYWGHNFSISRHTVKHVLSQVKKNDGKNIFRKELLTEYNTFESLVNESFLSLS